MFKRTDSEYLEKLSDEEFFARRFTLHEADRKELERHSCLIDGKRYYRATVKERILKKYAAETNPKPGEPGTAENPLVRFGKEYVYNDMGDLVEYIRGTVYYALRPDMKPTELQRKMAFQAGKRAITYDSDCPELSEKRLNAIARQGMRRNTQRAEALGGP